MLRLAVCSGIQPRAHGTSHIHFGERESSTAPGLRVQGLGHASWGLMETECPQSWSPLMGASGRRGQFLVMYSGPSTLNLSSIFKASSFNRLSCSITDSANKRVIITGGHSFGLSLKTVSIFDSNEYIGHIGSLINARESHGCTSYSVVGQTVKITDIIYPPKRTFPNPFNSFLL